MKKLLALLLAVTLMGTLFVGCSSDDDATTDDGGSTPATNEDAGSDSADDSTDDSSSDTDAPAEEVELRIMTMFGGTDPSTGAFEQQLADFQAANPNVTIVNESMTSVGDEFRTAVKTDFSTGNEPDVVFFYNGADVQGIIDAGGVVPYEEVWETYPEVGSAITDAVKGSMREEDGKIYCLPMTGFYEGLFVNKAIFEEYGLELPTTWDNLVTAIETLKDTDIVPFAGPLAQSHYMIEHFILSESNMDEYKSDLSEVPQSWVDGLNNIKDFYEMGAFSADAISMEIEASQNLFRAGNAAMILEGSWFIGGCDEELQANMTVVPMPTAPGGDKDPTSIVAGYSSGYYISRKAYDDAAKQQAVVDLVSYLTSADSIKAIAEANGGMPSAAVECEGLAQVVLDGQGLAGAAAEIALPIDSRLTPEAFNYIVKEGTPFIAYGERSAEDVLAEVQALNGN